MYYEWKYENGKFVSRGSPNDDFKEMSFEELLNLVGEIGEALHSPLKQALAAKRK